MDSDSLLFEGAVALCPPSEIASEWQAWMADAEALLAAPEVGFRSVLASLRCGVDMLREAASMVEALQTPSTCPECVETVGECSCPCPICRETVSACDECVEVPNA